MADASVSKTDVRKGVGVRISLSAPYFGSSYLIRTKRAWVTAGEQTISMHS